MTAAGELRLRWTAGLVSALVWICAFGYAYFLDDIHHAQLDPRQPFQTWRPPPAPDYAKPQSWLYRSDRPPATAAADVFFVHPTTFDGGKAWSGPLTGQAADEGRKVKALANFAGPFSAYGRIFAPRYRQASLFAYDLTRHDDARDARRFAYADVQKAFDSFLRNDARSGAIVLVGVEQGGQLVERLAKAAYADPALRSRIAAVYLIETVAAKGDFGPSAGGFPLCERREQSGCVTVYRSLFNAGPDRRRLVSRALVWSHEGWLEDLADRPPACVNPLTGKSDGASGGADLNLGAARAASFKEGERPALEPKSVEAACDDGLLRVSTPAQRDFQPDGDWTSRLRVPEYNLFWADFAADVKARLGAFYGRPLAEPIGATTYLRTVPKHVIPTG